MGSEGAMRHSVRALVQFIYLTRPLFLMGGVLLYMLGTVSAALSGYTLGFAEWLAGQLLVTFIQLMTHYANEYYDQESDRLNTDRTWFSGGSGVIVSGALPPFVARNAAWLMAGAALVALFFAARLSLPALPFGALALAAAWSYSGPPLYLVRNGWGEIVASLVVAGMVPVVGFIMQSHGPLPSHLLFTVLPLVLIHFAMLISFQIPDRAADALAGKHTICVRFGLRRTAVVHNIALVAAFTIIALQAVARIPGAGPAMFIFPLALWQMVRLHTLAELTADLELPQPVPPGAIPVSGAVESRSASRRYYGLTTRALGIFAASATLWLVGLVLLWIQS
jgi:1,4-dihydroxy-2-naphthoate octaprenyltransferase